MKEIIIQTGQKQSRILIGESLKNLAQYVPRKKLVVITDANIIKHYGHLFNQYPVVEIGLGEKHKTLDTLSFIMKKFVEYEVDRSWFVVGIGGGIVTDVTGFAASVYMRGMPFGFVSTTLLAQVDASVGGKNGVNYEGYKNMVGVFSQPDFVICDTDSLKTLDRKEYIAGFAEIIKAAVIKSNLSFAFLEANADKALQMNAEVLENIIYYSVKIKAEVVEADEFEKGERRKLNFGHTFAHSIEKHTGMLHGEAVAIGMVYASLVSANLGYISKDDALRVKKCIEKYSLPVASELGMDKIFEAMKKDKKREGDSLHLVLIDKIGQALVKPVLLTKLEEIVNDLR